MDQTRGAEESKIADPASQSHNADVTAAQASASEMKGISQNILSMSSLGGGRQGTTIGG